MLRVRVDVVVTKVSIPRSRTVDVEESVALARVSEVPSAAQNLRLVCRKARRTAFGLFVNG